MHLISLGISTLATWVPYGLVLLVLFREALEDFDDVTERRCYGAVHA